MNWACSTQKHGTPSCSLSSLPFAEGCLCSALFYFTFKASIESGDSKKSLKSKSQIRGMDGGEDWCLCWTVPYSLVFWNSPMQCLQRHFSAWFKLVLEHRIQMGKARALADWKCQLKALRAWRNYTWTQKVQQETQQLEDHLQDQNR